MPDDLYALDEDLAQRVLAGLSQLDSMRMNPLRYRRHRPVIHGEAVGQFFPAKITASLAEDYSWTEQDFQPDGTFIDKPGGRSGVYNGLHPAHDLNQTSGIANGTIVWMTEGDLNTNPSIGQEYEFDHEAGGSLEVKSSLGTPDFTGITKLLFAGATAATLTQPGAGQAQLNAFGASGTSHGTGLVPDPGATVGIRRFLREDATWQLPALPYGTGINSIGLPPFGGTVSINVSTTAPVAGTYAVFVMANVVAQGAFALVDTEIDLLLSGLDGQTLLIPSGKTLNAGQMSASGFFIASYSAGAIVSQNAIGAVSGSLILGSTPLALTATILAIRIS